ncbi:UDP-galactose transporter [Malassezia brasiliensis]|uniref:UDP-galactose transporter homolog 1 n=1 Tax=Malassezia brasiliensis TaxID=1821822 RepID=A0AAF0DTF4_9BASI|nr:UDP-galactose transporter [Malassezia brasiliensis]
MAKRTGLVQLALCALTIYAMFLVWGLLQEKITSTAYSTGYDPLDPFGEVEHFTYGVLLNAIQALFSCIAASAYMLLRTRHAPGKQSLLARLGLDVLTPRGCQRVLVARGQRPADAPLRGLSRYLSPLTQRYVLISAMQSTGSWLSIVSLRFLSFPAITLAKSSKLVPVLLMNVLLYRRKFAAYKYVVVLLVTLGVYMFMALGKPSPKKRGPSGSGRVGLALLAIHLLLDGTINSTQDDVFATYGTEIVTGTQMMLVMNAISATYMTLALLLPDGLGPWLVSRVRLALAELVHPHWIATVLAGGLRAPPSVSLTPQLVGGVQFLARHPDALRDVLLYAAAGAAGQIAIFETLERFGSLTLVSITVTRKLFTMLLSIVVYQHHLRRLQWVGVATVFAGLFLELREKRRQSAAMRAAKRQ